MERGCKGFERYGMEVNEIIKGYHVRILKNIKRNHEISESNVEQ